MFFRRLTDDQYTFRNGTVSTERKKIIWRILGLLISVSWCKLRLLGFQGDVILCASYTILNSLDFSVTLLQGPKDCLLWFIVGWIKGIILTQLLRAWDAGNKQRGVSHITSFWIWNRSPDEPGCPDGFTSSLVFP